MAMHTTALGQKVIIETDTVADKTKVQEGDVLIVETESDTAKGKVRTKVSIGTGGIQVKKDHDSTEGADTHAAFSIHYGMLDLGLLNMSDRTDYGSSETQTFLANVPADVRNSNLFALRESKSINVTIYPVLLKQQLVRRPSQKLILSTGLGLQIYNFRFKRPILYANQSRPELWTDDTTNFSKNKLGVTYLIVPLFLTSKTRLSKGVTLVYGAGISAGYRISSWTKQKSESRGKEKNHDAFNLRDFNACLQAEFGFDGIFRLFGTYQLTPLHDQALSQYPFSIGVRFLGI